MKVGYVLGDFRTGRQSTFPTLVQKVEAGSSIKPVVIYTHGDPKNLAPGIEAIRLEDYPLPPHWHQIEREHDIDIFHLSNIPKWGHIPTLLSETPVVATARGTAHWCQNVPSNSRRSDTRYKLDFRTRDILGRYTLDQVFTVSDYVSKTLSSRAGYSQEQLFTTYLGIEDEYFSNRNSSIEINVPDNYVLHVSNRSSIKNVETLVKSMDILVENHPDLHLVIVGRGWEQELQRECGRRGIADNIIFLGYISDIENLISLYDRAKLYVQTSLHETFGRPIIEAMARGTPVLTSEYCALDEIAGESAALIKDPRDPREIAYHISSLIIDSDVRSELSAKGENRSTKFRFDKYISRLKKGYRNVVHE